MSKLSLEPRPQLDLPKDPQPTSTARIDKTYRALAKLQRDGFWGSVVLKYKDGELTMMTTNEDFLVENLP